MIVDERIITFINSMDTENSEILETIEQEALAADVPIIRREMQSFLEVLLLMKKPMRVLEVGTAVGFSALLMSDYLPEGGHITTIENYEKRIPIARENFRRAGKEDISEDGYWGVKQTSADGSPRKRKQANGKCSLSQMAEPLKYQSMRPKQPRKCSLMRQTVSMPRK